MAPIVGIIASSKIGHLTPLAPTIGTATDGGTGSSATVAYTAAGSGPAATSFTATSSPGGFTGTGSSPITVSGLTAGTAYTFTVHATNAYGNSPESSASNSVTPITPSSFESIATVNPTGTTFSFTSIPSTYKSLQLRWVARAGSANIPMKINSDAGSNYAYHFLWGDGTTVSPQSAASSNNPIILRGSALASPYLACGIMDFIDYSSTSKYKTIKVFNGEDSNAANVTWITLGSYLWMSTSAITTLTFTTDDGSSFAASTFALYGIK